MKQFGRVTCQQGETRPLLRFVCVCVCVCVCVWEREGERAQVRLVCGAEWQWCRPFLPPSCCKALSITILVGLLSACYQRCLTSLCTLCSSLHVQAPSGAAYRGRPVVSRAVHTVTWHICLFCSFALFFFFLADCIRYSCCCFCIYSRFPKAYLFCLHRYISMAWCRWTYCTRQT